MGGNLHVDDSCIGCGECAAECPMHLITMVDEVPTVTKEQEPFCIGCQHCLAVCPTGALHVAGKNPADSLPLAVDTVLPDLDTLIRTRRSVRRYLPEAVERTVIDRMLQTVGYAPTGVNNRQVLLSVVDDPQMMERLRRKIYAALKRIIDAGTFPQGMDYLKNWVLDALENGRDNLFRDAPHLLLASSPKIGPCPEIDCHIALSYFDVLAPANGLGTLWSGLASWALAALTPEILREMGVPQDHVVGGVLVFGKPAVAYHRTVQRDDTRINRVRLAEADT